MLDPASCEEISSTRLWTTVSWTLQYVLARPWLALPLLLLLVLWTWRWSRKRSNRVRRRARQVALTLSILSLFTYATIASSLLVGVGNSLLSKHIPADTGEKAGAIVVLGRGPEQNVVRSQSAVALWKAKRAPIIFSSGRQDAVIIAQRVRELAVPESAIAGDPCSLTTEQNAELTAQQLLPQGIREVILVTDLPHMLRSRLVFESFGFEVISHVTPLADNTSGVEQSFLIVREGLGLLSYGFMGRYETRDIPVD